MRARGLLAAGVVAAAVACSDGGPTGDGRGEVTVRGEGGFVRISNARADHVYYFLVEREAAEVVEWEPCDFHPEACPHVHSGETISIAYADVAGWEPGENAAILFWWHLVDAAGGGLRVDEVRSKVFPLR